MMSKSKLFLPFLFFFFMACLTAQTLMPAAVFKENPLTHNMHITSDGNYLFTCNGGKPDLGQITKYSLDGQLIDTFKIELDMRSILFNPKDKKLYINTYGKELYRIDDLENGDFLKIYTFDERNEQCTPAFSADGKSILFLDNEIVYLYSMKDGSLKSQISGFALPEGTLPESTNIAVDKKSIYTWNPDEQMVFVFDPDGKFRKSFKVNLGNYSFSLSVANGMLWVAEDGNYETGIWYGYKL